MDPRTDVLAEAVRAKRHAVDNDLELIRLRARALDPRRQIAGWTGAAVPLLVGLAALWWWQRQRRRQRIEALRRGTDAPPPLRFGTGR